MKLTEHFDSSEFLCHHCGRAGIHIEVPEALEELRAALGRPIKINSGYRCKLHPAEVNKPPGALARHPQGIASDISVEGMTARELYSEVVKTGKFRGIGVSDSGDYVHVDLRPEPPARWCYNAAGSEVAWYEGPTTEARQA